MFTWASNLELVESGGMFVIPQASGLGLLMATVRSNMHTAS
jgi:hypothetical protein